MGIGGGIVGLFVVDRHEMQSFCVNVGAHGYCIIHEDVGIWWGESSVEGLFYAKTSF